MSSTINVTSWLLGVASDVDMMSSVTLMDLVIVQPVVVRFERVGAR